MASMMCILPEITIGSAASFDFDRLAIDLKNKHYRLESHCSHNDFMLETSASQKCKYSR